MNGLTLDIAPFSWRRPKGGARRYSDPALENFKRKCAWILRSRYPGITDMPVVWVDRIYVVARPQSMRGRKFNKGLIVKDTRPDVDNYDKAFFDALEDSGIVADDGKVIGGYQAKFYAEVGGKPRIIVRLQSKPSAEALQQLMAICDTSQVDFGKFRLNSES